MSPVAQVPSHTPLLIDKFLDMISDNKMGHRIPPGLHFKDKSGNFVFRDRVAPYLQGFTTRVCANVLTPHGGGAGSNNATESQNKMAHKQMPVRKPPVAHVVDQMCYAPSAAGGRQDRVLDFRTAMKSAPLQCIVMPTFKTMQTVIQNYPTVFQAHKEMTNAQREMLIKDFLCAPTQKPKVGPSWLASFLGCYNVGSALALEDMTFTKWYDLVHSFALMPPLTDKDSVARYLGRLEKGIPIRDKSSTRLGNGCQVHWDKVPDTGIYYCLCPDHLCVCSLSRSHL
jgi:hypothetical protein